MTSLELLWAVRDLRDDRLKVRHKAVLMALVAFKSNAASGPVRAYQSELGRAAGLHRNNAWRALVELHEFGFVTIDELEARRGARTPATKGGVQSRLAVTINETLLPSVAGVDAEPATEQGRGCNESVQVPATNRGSTCHESGHTEDLLRKEDHEDPRLPLVDAAELEATSTKPTTRTDPVRCLFEHYLAVRAKHVRGGLIPKLKPAERRRAKTLLAAGYTREQLELACEGLFVDEFCVREKRQQFFHALSERMVDRLSEAGSVARGAATPSPRESAVLAKPAYSPPPPEFAVEMRRLLSRQTASLVNECAEVGT